KRPPTATPFIYSREELRRLLKAIPAFLYYRFSLEPSTMRAILLLFYGAGLRRCEVLNLLVTDVDLPNRVITIREGKFFKSRLVPIGSHLTKVLSDYARWRAATRPSAKDRGLFFASRHGTAIRPRALDATFQ